MTLRPYQQEAVDAAMAWMRKSVDPFLIEAATGAGKSHIIAAIAAQVHGQTGKRVLCLAPSAELVVQNREKFLATGSRASMFSASAGAKELRYPVVFGSPLTVKNRISRFGAEYGLVVIDECHGTTPTVQAIVDAMRAANPNLRICGLSATPYRLGKGYIFRMWPDGRVNGEDQSREPYYTACVYSVGARDLIRQGFLTEPVIGAVGAQGYDTAGLVANAMGKFDAAAVDRAYHGHGRKTAAIVQDVVTQAADRKGVMFFAATVQHAGEVMASLPPHLSAIVTAETPKPERNSILSRFKARDLKYLVNVSVLTTGFDAPHVDVIAILRKTESVGLLQQIIGRGLRIDPGKRDCLVLDYTTNLEDHCPDGDLFNPEVKAGKAGEKGAMEVTCPDCGCEQAVSANTQYLDYKKDDAGYCLDLDGNQVMTEFGPLSGHFGRRCSGMVRVGLRGEYARCDYRWTSKPCPHCEAPNDIAARYCTECRGEIVDPNKNLVAEFKAMKRDPSRLQTDAVLSFVETEGVSAKGNKTVRVDFVTPYRKFSVWLMPEAPFLKGQRDWAKFTAARDDLRSVTYKKEDSGFYAVFGFNGAVDVEPETADIRQPDMAGQMRHGGG